MKEALTTGLSLGEGDSQRKVAVQKMFPMGVAFQSL